MAPAGDEPVVKPIPPETAPEMDTSMAGRTGYGELIGGAYEELTSLHGGPGDGVNQYPETATALEKASWHNYSLRADYPPLVSATPQDNQRIWQEMEVEKRLDYTPPHDVHATDLPDYHFWPGIQNELNAKPDFKPEPWMMTWRHHADHTDVPRFFKTGTPKTPVQDQDWYVPLKSDGRFDWRENIRRNGYTASIFSADGWHRRYLLPIAKVCPPMVMTGFKGQMGFPAYFRYQELPVKKRIARFAYGSFVDPHLFGICGYWLILLGLCAGDAHWRRFAHDNEFWNYDYTYARYNRDKGGFHGLL